MPDHVRSQKDKKAVLALMIFSFVSGSLCLMLFYVDEGRYTLEGLFQPANVLALMIYGGVFMAILNGIFWSLPKKVPFFLSTTASILGLFMVLATFIKAVAM